MAKPLRRLPLQAMYNVRDIGGYATADGGITRFGRLFRADSPTNLPDEDIETILAAGVRTVIDLRASDELARSPCSLEFAEGIVYHSISLMGNGDALRTHMGLSAQDSFVNSLTTLYASMVDVNPDRFVKVFQIMADSFQHGAVLFNCTAGKDRTGIIAAMTLLLCGVSKFDVVADYSISEILLEPRVRHWAKSTDAMVSPNVFRSEADTIRQFLAHLEEQHGGVEKFLLDNGMDAAALHSIVEQLVDRE